MSQQDDEPQPAPIEPGHVMSREKYDRMVAEQQK